MRRFEVISSYKDKGINIPVRATAQSAGYDIEAAETIVVPSLWKSFSKWIKDDTYVDYVEDGTAFDLMDPATKAMAPEMKGTLIATGLKAYCKADEWIKIVPRSSIGGKFLLTLPNNVGVIDADYADNPDNEGHIHVMFINLKPFDIRINKGDKIAQAIFCKYNTTDDDIAEGERGGGFGSTNAS